MKLILAEKPSVGKDIAKALGIKNSRGGYMEGNGYVVTWALGHLVTLKDPEKYDEKYKSWDLNHLPIIPEKLGTMVIPQSSKQYKIVKELIGKASRIIIATDAGREGELVARWILNQAKNKAPIKRLWISSVTDKAIKMGFANLKDGDAYVNLYNSAQSRAMADWLVGINATRALTTKFNASLSCGRVQTPTLAIIHKREEDIRAFRPREFYGVCFTHQNIKFTLQGDRIFQPEKAAEILEYCQNQEIIVKDIAAKVKKSNLTGYDLTALQQDANRLYNLSAGDTLNAAQKLYEYHKVLTYPRTDSKHLTSDIKDTLRERIKAVNFAGYSKFATRLLKEGYDPKGFINDSKVTDHHAIIPTEEEIDLSELGSNERKIYDLAVKRFLALLGPSYEYEETTITLKVGEFEFTAKGKRIIQPGYKEIYGKGILEEEEDNDQNLPIFKKGQKLKGNFAKTTGKTTPPAYFTEGTLLMAMENPVAFMENKEKDLVSTIKEAGGLGTVATRADIIEKLHNSGSVETRGKFLHTTPKGRQLLGLVPSDLRSPALTAKWEQELTRISKGQQKKEIFLKEIENYTKKIINEIKSSNASFKHDNITTQKCPDCHKFLLLIQGKKGKYLVCQDKECGHRKNVELNTNARCPKCHKKLTLANNVFICVCGHKEKKEAFEERRKREGDKLNKRDVQKYIAKINANEERNNPFGELAKLLETGK